MKQKSLFIIFTVISIIGYGAFVYAAAPIGGYTPGQTLNPDCAPGDVDCVVALPASWSLTGNSGTIAGTNFLGTTDNQGLVFKTNNNQTGYISDDGLSIQFGLGAGGSNGSIARTNFFGQNAGSGATAANDSNFFGSGAGRYAISADHTNFFGQNAGSGATAANDSNFFGTQAGFGATGANNSNFFGWGAGEGATGAFGSNFFGNVAGFQASGAYYSNFIGDDAGDTATNAYQSNFIGNGAGENATEAYQSNFFGVTAGEDATNANNSNFIGFQAGYGSINASQSNFIGLTAGTGAINAHDSTFIGTSAGFGAATAANSIFIGNNAGVSDTVNNIGSRWSILIGNDTSTGGFYNSIAMGRGAVNTSSGQFILSSAITKINLRGIDYTLPFAGGANGTMLTTNASGVLSWTSALPSQTGNSGKFLTTNGTTTSWSSAGGLLTGATNTAGDETWLGVGAGTGATTQYTSFIGRDAGKNASGAFNSNFFGWGAGNGATSAVNSNFIGTDAGKGATGAVGSNFLGLNAGFNAVAATNSNFFGYTAGQDAGSASYSNFFGTAAGGSAYYASYSNFLGNYAGTSANNASYSNFLGFQSGRSAQNASNSIFIGFNAGYNDVVNNTGNIDDFSILIGKSTSTGGYSNSIALGGSAVNTAPNQLMIGSGTRPIDTLVLTGSGGNTCVLDVTIASPSCSSDENLKTNIENLSASTLETLLKVKTVSYNWRNYPTKGIQVGFLAQDLEQYFPQVVSIAPNGFKTVSYGGMAPILVEAIREMNLKMTMLSDMSISNTWRDSLIGWLANAANGITDIFAKRIHTDELCVGTVCVTQEQFLRMTQDHNVPTPITTTITTPTDIINTDMSGNDNQLDIIDNSPENTTPSDQSTLPEGTTTPTVEPIIGVTE